MDTRNINTSEALERYFKHTPEICEPYGNGHINDTFLVDNGKQYILQRMNTTVFPRPEELMENIIGVTGHIRRKAEALGSDAARSTLTVVPTGDGEMFYRDGWNNYWRLYEFVEGTVTRESIENPTDFAACGEAFGNFQQMLSDYPAEKLHASIENFHNTPWRYNNFMRAVKNDAVGRLQWSKADVEFVKKRADFTKMLELSHESGKLPLRVTHNDTKLNNILFDAVTGAPVCVIDLDTVMPGYSVNDFGDSIRFGANTAAEDETDLAKVSLDIDLFKLYAEGFIKGCGGKITDSEIMLLPIGAMMMTFECGMRFLTDYLEGDVYFKIHRPLHNLDRARNQFALLRDMEEKYDAMIDIVKGFK